MTDPLEPVIGIMPAAGLGQRSATLPCSKEIVPLGLRAADGAGRVRARPACDDLLTGFRLSGAERAIVVIRPGKWDIPAFLGDGAAYGLHLAYVTAPSSPGVPWTVRAALPFVTGARVVLGFPDVLLRPHEALARLVAQQRRSGAEVTLGLFPARHPDQVDMVDVDADGRVRDIIIKPTTSTLRLTWLLACWRPAFGDFLADYVTSAEHAATTRQELFLGDVVRAARDAGRLVDTVTFHDGAYRDIGTPAELATALTEPL